MELRVVVVAALAVTGIGCSKAPVVAVVAPVSGADSAYGVAVERGVDLALADEAGQLPKGFEMVRVDSASNPATAAETVRRLVKDRGVQVVVGGVTSAEAEALLPVVDDEKVICLSPSATGDGLADRSRYFFRLAPTDEEEGRTAARHLVDNRGVETVVIFTDDSRLTRDVEAEFRQNFQMKLGKTIIGTVHLGDPGWKKRASDLVNAYNPDAAYIVGHADRILDSLVALEVNGYKGVRCVTSTFYLADVLASAGPVADNVIFPLPVYDVASEKEPARTFVAEFESRYGQSPDIFSAQGFDATRVAVQTLLGARSLYSEEIRRSLAFDVRDFLGVTGAISFTEAGDVRRYPVMHCIKDGRVRPCSTLADEIMKGIGKTLGNKA